MKKGLEIGEFRENLGKPYQIYTEIIDKGKNISGTKRKIKWQFGWSDSDIDHEVTLVHSIISGKKTVYENGVEITSSQDVLATEFAYGWNALAGLHVYRIDCFFPILGEYSYLFSVDGVRFNNFPRRRGERRYPEKLGGDNKIDGFNVDTNATIVTTNNNKGTAKTKSTNDNNQRNDGNTGKNTVKNKSKVAQNDRDRTSSFDPFDVPEAATTDRKDSFDPFAEEAPKPEVKTTITSVTLTTDDFIEMSDVSATPAKSEVFDFLNDYNDTQSTTTTTSSTPAVDIFSSVPNPREVNLNNFDQFAAPTVTKSSNTVVAMDPFALIDAAPKPITSNSTHSNSKESEFADKLNVPKKLINFDFSLPDNKTAKSVNGTTTNKPVGGPKAISGIVDPFASLTVKKPAAPFNPSTNPPATVVPSKTTVPVNPFAPPVAGGKAINISNMGISSQQLQGQKGAAKTSIDQLDWKM